MTKPPVSDLERSDPYRARPADDGGMYLLLPRDEHLLPPLPERSERFVIAWPLKGGEPEQGDSYSEYAESVLTTALRANSTLDE